MSNEHIELDILLRFFGRFMTLVFISCLLSVGSPDLIDAAIHWLMK